MIEYIDDIKRIQAGDLKGFFVGWPNPPASEKHLLILANSEFKILAIDMENKKVVGFITAISDGVLNAYIPFLEVLPEYKERGIGTELVRRMLDKVNSFYMIDLTCDEELQKFYGRLGMKKSTGMMIRNPSKLK